MEKPVPFFFKWDLDNTKHTVADLLAKESQDNTVHIQTDLDSWEADF